MKFLSAVFFLILSTLASRGEEIDVVLYDNPPLIILEEGKKPSGIVPDFFRALQKETNLDFRFHEASFVDAKEMTANGKMDVMPALAQTYERQQLLKFSKVFLLRNRAVLFRRQNFVFHEMEDLAGKKVALIRDDVHAEAFQELCEIYGITSDIQWVESYDEALESLLSGKVDLAVLNEIYSSQLKREDAIVSTYVSFNPVEIRIGYNKEVSPELISQIDEVLSRQQNETDSVLNRAIVKYLSPQVETQIPLILWALLGAVLIVVFVVIGLNRILRKLVEQRTEELRLERDRAAAADRAKAHFLGNVSHEIRTPLNGILGFCQLLESSEDLGSSEKESVEAIVESGRRLESLLTAILRYSDMASEVQQSVREPIVVETVALEVIEILGVRFEEAKGLIQADFTGVEARSYLTDPNAWYVILENLIGNAIKFGNGSPISVKMSEGKSNKGVRVLRLEVEDGGEGISSNDRERVFLPFEQVDGTLTRRHEGVGLGLSLVRSNVNLLGGTVALSQAEAGGLRVVIEVPVLLAQ